MDFTNSLWWLQSPEVAATSMMIDGLRMTIQDDDDVGTHEENSYSQGLEQIPPDYKTRTISDFIRTI